MNKKIKIKSVLNITIFIVITALVLYFLLKDNFKEVINGLLHANIFWIIVAIFFIFGYWFFKSIIFYNFTRKFNKDYKFKKAFKLQLMTNFFNAVTPFSSGGQPFQIYSLKKQGIEITSATNIIVQNFIVYQIALVLFGIGSIISNYFFHFFEDVGLLKQLVTMGFIINALITIGLFIIAFAKGFNKIVVNWIINLLSKIKIVKNKEKNLENWNTYINNFHNGAKILIANKWFFIKSILCAILALACQYLIPVILLYSTGDYTSFNGFQSIVACSYVMLIGSFVPIPGGTGGLEYGFMAFYGNFISGTTINVILILWRFVTYYLGLIIGAIAVNIKEGDHKCE